MRMQHKWLLLYTLENLVQAIPHTSICFELSPNGIVSGCSISGEKQSIHQTACMENLKGCVAAGMTETEEEATGFRTIGPARIWSSSAYHSAFSCKVTRLTCND